MSGVILSHKDADRVQKVLRFVERNMNNFMFRGRKNLVSPVNVRFGVVKQDIGSDQIFVGNLYNSAWEEITSGHGSGVDVTCDVADVDLVEVGQVFSAVRKKDRWWCVGLYDESPFSSDYPSSEDLSSEHPSSEHPSSAHYSSAHPSSHALSSGEELSSAEPSSEAPSSAEPSSEELSSEAPSSEHPSSDHPSSAHPSSAHPSSDAPSSGEELSSGEEPSSGELSSGFPSSGALSSSELPSSAEPSSEAPSSGALSSSELPSSAEPSSEAPSSDHPSSDASSEDQPPPPQYIKITVVVYSGADLGDCSGGILNSSDTICCDNDLGLYAGEFKECCEHLLGEDWRYTWLTSVGVDCDSDPEVENDASKVWGYVGITWKC